MRVTDTWEKAGIRVRRRATETMVEQHQQAEMAGTRSSKAEIKVSDWKEK